MPTAPPPVRNPPAPPRDSRGAHRRRLLADPDVLHGLAVAAVAMLASGGLVYLVYLAHVWRTARRAPVSAPDGRVVLVFGKHAPGGRPDADFQVRLDRAMALWREGAREFVLLGGGASGQPSEAALARAGLRARGMPADAVLRLEDRSRDTLQNLRNARALLDAEGGGEAAHRVVLLSSRYHLARCLWFARRMGFDARPCAAEAHLPAAPGTAWRLAGEAAYVALVDLGTRWARLIGSRRLLARTQ
ncbi:YdcF family protein [Marilutibacter maris]|uniref:DUF218 domain-containing protein n=1 Tax=Marilutibacter maris TaxID=1605891 RepID=A0A2U9TC59_9GAMM|nr:YdcF family protein [Lysobacter maris]AWV08787.1 hypothetical protein C9I47_3123 [Lysobacter maris]